MTILINNFNQAFQHVRLYSWHCQLHFFSSSTFPLLLRFRKNPKHFKKNYLHFLIFNTQSWLLHLQFPSLVSFNFFPWKFCIPGSLSPITILNSCCFSLLVKCSFLTGNDLHSRLFMYCKLGNETHL